MPRRTDRPLPDDPRPPPSCSAQRGYHATTFLRRGPRKRRAPAARPTSTSPGGQARTGPRSHRQSGVTRSRRSSTRPPRHANNPASLIRALAPDPRQPPRTLGATKSGCAIATMVLELAPRDDEFSADFDRVFTRWRGRRWLPTSKPLGPSPPTAPQASPDLTISAFEGALVLSRARPQHRGRSTPQSRALISAIDHDTSRRPAAR